RLKDESLSALAVLAAWAYDMFRREKRSSRINRAASRFRNRGREFHHKARGKHNRPCERLTRRESGSL
ncbi:MAG: hypothetical protein VXZ53_01375, partial [Planctomycetota bacterium]|nr:hypothetical protein [Planctomycetota bacterium]